MLPCMEDISLLAAPASAWAEIVAFVVALLSAALLGWTLRGRRPAGLPPAHARVLGQAVTEAQSIGLALRRLAASHDMPRDEAQALALQLLEVADHLGDLLVRDSGPRRLREEELRLKPLLEEALAIATAQLGSNARACRLDASLAPVLLRADARALRGAVVQVLVRAARLTGPQDGIDIRFARLGNLVAIIIEDEGSGLAADDLASRSPAAHSRGLGFGLSLARSLLHAHGGDLVFETASGVGTRAWLTLPETRLLEAPQPAQA